MSIDMGFWNDPVVKWGVVAALTLFGIFYMRMRISGARAKEADKKKDPSFHEAKRSVDRLENLDRDLKEIEEEFAHHIPEGEKLFKGERSVQREAPKLRLIEGSEFVSLEEALQNTKRGFFARIAEAFSSDSGAKGVDFDKIEEALYTSDLGPQTVQRLLETLTKKLPEGTSGDAASICAVLRGEMLSILEGTRAGVAPLNRYLEPGGSTVGSNLNSGDATQSFSQNSSSSPTASATQIWMIVGVNGAGKTTTIGKLSYHLAASGKKVLVAAGDTFRAAAGEQLKAWTERAQVEIFAPPGIDSPSAVAFDAVKTGLSGGFDFVLIDTAGRLHTQKNLMEELAKVKRVIAKAAGEAFGGKSQLGSQFAVPGAMIPSGPPQEILLVLDANSGQNALVQAREFHQVLGVTGVVLTKLDGTAKGGVAVGLASEIGLPVQLIGVGEKKEDLRPFDPKAFVEAII